MDDQVEAELARAAVAEGDHVTKLPRRVDVQERERQPGRRERLEGKVEEDGRILADRVQHDRMAALGDRLANDVDALRLELLQMRELASAEVIERRRVHDF